MPDDIIQTRELRIVDSHGQIKAVLRADDDKTALTFATADPATNQVRSAIALGVGVDGVPVFSLVSPTGYSQLSLSSSGETCNIIMVNGENRFQISLLHSEKGNSLMLCDSQGVPRIDLTVPPNGTPTIALIDADGDERLV